MWVLTRQGKAESSSFSRVLAAEEHAVCLLFQGRLCWAMTLETIIPISFYKRRHERGRKFVKRSLNIDG